uniref:Uncharacterized protein n=1 Tax=Methanococcus maripaludis (strain C5 / ATCC BAA-1333) TaxID=402880 RepID=O06113_METM5|nr:unknown [Methanococcus maripaludis C5]
MFQLIFSLSFKEFPFIMPNLYFMYSGESFLINLGSSFFMGFFTSGFCSFCAGLVSFGSTFLDLKGDSINSGNEYRVLISNEFKANSNIL